MRTMGWFCWVGLIAAAALWTPCQSVRAEVLFNFFGHVLDLDPDGKSVFRRSVDPCGSAHSPVNGRYHALAVSAAILGERVRFKFVYSKNLHRRETLRQLAAGVRKSFQS